MYESCELTWTNWELKLCSFLTFFDRLVEENVTNVFCNLKKTKNTYSRTLHSTGSDRDGEITRMGAAGLVWSRAASVRNVTRKPVESSQWGLALPSCLSAQWRIHSGGDGSDYPPPLRGPDEKYFWTSVKINPATENSPIPIVSSSL